MEKGKIYLTKEGAEKIKKQYQDLWEIRKAKSSDDIPQFLQSEASTWPSSHYGVF